MQFDFTKTLSLIKGGLLDHENTWKTYLEDCPDWKQTALVLTGPLFILNILLSLIFSKLTGGYAMYGYHGNWAEHEWVKQQLRVAHIQQGEGSDEIAHNYKLYKEYEEELNED